MIMEKYVSERVFSQKKQFVICIFNIFKSYQLHSSNLPCKTRFKHLRKFYAFFNNLRPKDPHENSITTYHTSIHITVIKNHETRHEESFQLLLTFIVTFFESVGEKLYRNFQKKIIFEK